MILINVASRIRAAINDPVLDRQIEESIAILRKDFMHPEFKALLETVGPNGEFIDTNATRTINPGHCIETSWFILEEAKNRNWDKEMVDTALTILDWSWEWGWDKEYGGIINFRDCRNLPSQDYAHDMKFWWPQTETIIASLYAYLATGDDEYIYKQFMLLSLHGQTKDALHKNGLGNWEYDIVAPSYKCNMTDIQAAIGLVQLDRYEGLLKRRRDIIERYDEAFKTLGHLTVPHFTDRHTSSGHLYLLRILGIGVDRRNELIVQMAERGIATNVHFKPLPMMTAYKNMGFDIADFPNAYHQYENEITLPLNTKLSDEDVEYIINNLLEILHE